MTPVVIAGVGYRDLRDHSLGVRVTDALGSASLPEGVAVHDLSYNPVAVAQWVESLAPEGRPSRWVFVSAVERDRSPGTVIAYRWNGELPDDARIRRAIEDAVTGVIFLDNTLIVLGWLVGQLPEVVVVEVEPALEAFGDRFSPVVERAFGAVTRLVVDLATEDGVADRLPLLALGGLDPAESARE